MNRYVRTLAIVFAASSLVFTGVANGQRATSDADTAAVTWKDAPQTSLMAPSASAGSKVVKDAEPAGSGRLAQASFPTRPLAARRKSSTRPTAAASPSSATT